MKPNLNSLLLSVAASIFLIIVGCGGGGGGGGGSAPILTIPADLSVTKSVDVASPDVGTDVVFTITVSNAGPSNATGVVVTDLLPSGFSYVTDNSGGAYDSTTGRWSIGTLAVGTNQTLAITATVNDTGNYINRAEATANESDPNTDNNFDGVSAAPPGISVAINQIQTACNTGTTSDNAFVTVVDQLGNPITDLNDLMFTLTEGLNSQDYPVNEFTVDFVNQNFSISIVMDYSQSMYDRDAVTPMEDAVVELINQLSADDEAEIIKFNNVVTVVQGFTTDKNKLIAAVDKVFPPFERTELYEAIIKGIDDAGAIQRPAKNVKAVVVITDGRNNTTDPSITADTVIADALSKDIPVYTVGLGSESDWIDLEKIASDTGGIFYPSYQSDDLAQDFANLAATLIKNQYVFTYSSGLPGGASAPGTLTVEADYNGLIDSDTRGYTSCP